VVAVEVWDTGVPVWSLLLAMALPVLYILPSGFIFAMTGQSVCGWLSASQCWWYWMCCLDYHQYSGSNYPWDTPSRQPVREHGLQGILCTDPFGSYEFRTRFEIGSLYQGPAKGDLPWCAHLAFGCNIDSLIFYTCSPNDRHSSGGVRSSRSEALDIREHPWCLLARSSV